MKARIVRIVLLGSAFAAAGACALNPQPIPPEDQGGDDGFDNGGKGSMSAPAPRDASTLPPGRTSDAAPSSSGNSSSSGGSPSDDGGITDADAADDGGPDAPDAGEPDAS